MEIKSVLDFVRMTRGVLAAAGFTRHEHDGAVYWTGPAVIPSGVEGPGREGREDPASRAAHPGPSTHVRDDRPSLVLLHGANDHAGTWFAVAPTLAKQYRVIIPDLAGHGESAPKTGSIPFSTILSQLDSILTEESTIVGNSLGGWIALLFALRHPERVKRLFLEASGGLTRPLAVPLVAHNHDEALVILRAVHGPDYQPQEWVIDALLQRANDSPLLRLTELEAHSIESRLGEIHVPATLVWGADDGVVPLAYGEELQRAIPGATLCVIDGAAHIPHLQQPVRFLQCLTSTS